MRLKRSIPCTLALCAAFGLHASAAAADARIQTELKPGNVFLGESAHYQVFVDNASGEKPDLAHLEADFKVEYLNSSTQQNMSIVGGRVNKFIRVTHDIRLTPRRAGTLTVPGPVMDVEGRKIKGPDQALVVSVPEKQDIVLAEVVTSAPQAYPTQEFDVTLRILVRPLPDAPNRDPLTPLDTPAAIQLDWQNVPEGLQALEELDAWLGKYQSRSDFGFSLNGLTVRGGGIFGRAQLFLCNLLVGRETRAAQDGSKIEYHLYELKRTFRAEKTGTFRFGPAVVKGTFATSGRAGAYSGRRLFVSSNEAVVEVRDVPANRPATFSGAIGGFDLSASAEPKALRVGDPLTLTLAFHRKKGAGSLDRLGALDLSASEKLAADFEIVDRNPTGEVSGETKTFVYRLRPKRAGVSIPEIAAHVFDPLTASFVPIQSAPIGLSVTEAAALNTAEIVGSLTPRAGQDLRSADQGVFQNVLAVSELRNQKPEPFLALLLSGAAWAGALLGCVLIARRRSFAGDVAWQRREAARRNAERQLAAARAAQQPAEAARQLRGALLGLVADMRNRPSAGLTTAEAAQELKAAGVSDELFKRTTGLLEMLDALEYAPRSAADLAAHAGTAAALVPELHRALEKSR